LIFTIDRLTHRHRFATRNALVDVSLTIEAGQTIALLGHSGSGKTTLLRLLGLLWTPRLRPGVLRLTEADGTPVDYATLRFRADRRAYLRREVFGFVMQSPLLLPHLSCQENTGLPLALRGVGKKAWSSRVDSLVREADPDGELTALCHRRAREVSGGERQRFAILRAIVHDPEVLFADEPVSNLDPDNAARLLEVLDRWRLGELPGQEVHSRPRTLILVSHNVRAACGLANRVIVLRRGAVERDILIGPASDRPAVCQEVEEWMRQHG
jgi:ABC-type lipoprotein export system ATPase subunit